MDHGNEKIEGIVIKWVADGLGSVSAFFFCHRVSYSFFLGKKTTFLRCYELNIEKCNVSYIDGVGGGPKNA